MANLQVHKKSKRSLANTNKEESLPIASHDSEVAHQQGVSYERKEETKVNGNRDGQVAGKTNFERGENDGSNYLL